MKRMERYVDPRTKLFLLLTMNIVLLNTGTGVFLSWLKFVIGFLPFVLLLTAGRWKMAENGMGLSVRLSGQLCDPLRGACAYGWSSHDALWISRIHGNKISAGRYARCLFLCSTRVNEFVAAMERMHIPQKVIIPVSVMFRFFPTVREETAGISDAMRMRKLGFRYFFTKPVEILEYRLVPLMIAVVNIGEDLSASALTRCLGREEKRTCISRVGFGVLDVLLFVTGTVFVTLYFLVLGGVLGR